MTATEPKFVMFIRAVEGRAVHRWGSVNPDEMFGARRVRLTAEQKAAGEAPILWDTERVVPIDEIYLRRFRGALERAIRHGDLERADEKAYRAWQRIAADREAKAEAARKAEVARLALEAKKATEATEDPRGGKKAEPRAAEERNG